MPITSSNIVSIPTQETCVKRGLFLLGVENPTGGRKVKEGPHNPGPLDRHVGNVERRVQTDADVRWLEVLPAVF